MNIVYTSKFLKLQKKLRDKKTIEDTNKVIEVLRNAKDVRDLFKPYSNISIQTKDYSIDKSYRIGYSNSPSMRIRFCINDNPATREKEVVLYLVMTKQEYKPWETKPINCNNLNESVQKRIRILISESQFNRLFSN
jgi:hypothetical protein